METTKKHILDLLNARELQTAKSSFLPQNPREVLKEEKTKRLNYVSRSESEETGCVKVSDETCLLASTSSTPRALVSQEISLESETSSPGEEALSISSSRGFTGISLQHSRPRKGKGGVKVMVNLQSPEQAQQGDVTLLTAELKRWDRLRELRDYEPDSEEFAELWTETIQTLKSMPAQQRRSWVLGRLHDRGSRSEWYPDMMLLGRLDDQDQLIECLLNINGEEYQIAMTASMSDKQLKSYYTSGIHGVLRNNRPVPSLKTAPTRKL